MPDLQYISTRGQSEPLNFEQAMLAGLASDGGLFVPDSWPSLEPAEFEAMSECSYEEVVRRVVQPFVGAAFSANQLSQLASESYEMFRHPAKCPLQQLDSGLFVLELFHGPTLAFKDFAMQMVGRMFDRILRRRDQRVTIVGATSGDTGSAAIEAFRGQGAADVFILYPHGRVSEVQRRQMTTPVEGNVHALAVDGDFDDCQAVVKDMFNDAAFRQEMNLGAVNSINWARLVVQTAYFVAAGLALGAPHRKISFAVPTGNFGDVFSGYVAKQMGLPIEKLVVATNQNDILHRALNGGSYIKDRVHATDSPSMDIQVSSNFERALFEASGKNGSRVRNMMQRLGQGGFHIEDDLMSGLRQHYSSGMATEEETRSSLQNVWKSTGQLVCPHSAVGIKVAQEFFEQGQTPMIAVATAHPAKFPDAVKRATGIHPSLPDAMADIFDRPERTTKVDNDLAQIQSLIRERVQE